MRRLRLKSGEVNRVYPSVPVGGIPGPATTIADWSANDGNHPYKRSHQRREQCCHVCHRQAATKAVFGQQSFRQQSKTHWRAQRGRSEVSTSQFITIIPVTTTMTLSPSSLVSLHYTFYVLQFPFFPERPTTISSATGQR